MATKKRRQPGTTKKEATPQTQPLFPYTTKPASLRRLLQEIPKKPRPPKFDMAILKSWGFSDQNDHSMLRVLKSVNLLNDKNEPTDLYGRFMSIGEGAAVLGPEIKRVYAPMFQASHTPYNESSEKLQNLFNIHSGGGERALDQQIQTFKALCENATFDQTKQPGIPQGSPAVPLPNGLPGAGLVPPVININLHIHLPENKTRRDYEDIIEDIGRHIFGRTTEGRSDK